MDVVGAKPLRKVCWQPRTLALFATVLGGVGLAGWVGDSTALRTILHGFPAMSVNTALSIMCCGLALYVTSRNSPSHGLRRALDIGLLLVLTLACLSLVSYASGQRFEVLYLLPSLLPHQESLLISSPYTAVVSVALALALLVEHYWKDKRGFWFSQGLAVAALAVLLMVATGYLFSIAPFYRINQEVGMAVHTFAGMLLLVTGVINLHPEKGVSALYWGSGFGSQVLRRFFPLGAVAVVLFYLLGIWGQEYAGESHAVAFVLILFTLFVLLGSAAAHLNREAALKEQVLEEYEELFEGNPDAIVVVDEQGTIVQVNAQTEDMSGYDRTELVGSIAEKLVPERFRTKHAELRQHFQLNPRPRPIGNGLQTTMQCRNGQECPVAISIRPAQLGDRCVNILALRDMRDRKRLEQHLETLGYAAGHDSLTGLPNRRVLSDLIERELAAANRHGKRVAICFCDLDGFKEVNDTHGHQVGDALLVEMARRMADCVRRQDVVARVGGDEFIIVLADLDELDDAERVGKTLVTRLAEPCVIEGRSLTLTASIGISFYPDHGSDMEQLINRADEVLYVAKNGGKNQLRVYGSG